MKAINQIEHLGRGPYAILITFGISQANFSDKIKLELRPFLCSS